MITFSLGTPTPLPHPKSKIALATAYYESLLTAYEHFCVNGGGYGRPSSQRPFLTFPALRLCLVFSSTAAAQQRRSCTPASSSRPAYTGHWCSQQRLSEHNASRASQHQALRHRSTSSIEESCSRSRRSDGLKRSPTSLKECPQS